MPGGRTGRRRRRARRFSTGVSVIRLRLGFSHRRIINPSNQIGAIYVPTKWGGTFTVRATRTSDGTAKRVRLFYKDGTITNPPTAQEIRNGLHALGAERRRFRYDIPVGRVGWFFVVVAGTSRARVRNTFIQNHSLSRRPWNTWYWPGANNKNPNLYDTRVRYRGPPGPRDDGPLVKYDAHTNQTTPATSAREEEWRQMGQGIPAGSVGGHCDATAWAGFEETRPTGSKTVTSAAGVRVTFRDQDRIGMCTLRYWTGDSGERNHDGTAHYLFVRGDSYLNADWFHNKLRERIANDVGGIQIHDSRNWNYGVFHYRASFVGYGTSDLEIKKVTITTRLTFVDWGKVRSSIYRKWHGGPNRRLSTIYDLEYRNDGTIDSQLSWPKASIRGGVSRRIEFVWYSNPSAPLINSNVEKHVLESIFR